MGPFISDVSVSYGGGVSLWANGLKVTVHKDQKFPSYAFCWNADGNGVGFKNRENLPTT